MKCADFGEFEFLGGKYRNYLCHGTTSFFLRLTLIVRYAKLVNYWQGILTVDFHSIWLYLHDEERLTFKRLTELLRKAREENTEIVRYIFSLGPFVQVLTPEPEVFRRIFRVTEAGAMSWVVLGKQAVRYVDGVISMFGLHRAPQTLMYFIECVTKKYLEEIQSK